MALGVLTRHTPNFDDESLFPYGLRLTAENGYETPSSLLSFCKIKPPALRPSLDLSKLAAAANTTRRKLEKIGYKSKGGRHNALLLGHEIRAHDLRLTTPQVCVDCVIELQYIQAHFDLALMVACPVHRIMLATSCHRRHPLSWLRPDLLECKCGATLRTFDRSPIDDSARDLLDVVRMKVLGLSIPNVFRSGIPAKHLGRMQLRSLLYVIETIGRRSPAGLLPIHDNPAILARASKVLSDWPHNFFSALEEFEKHDWGKTGALLTKGDLRGFYMALMYGVKPEGEALFLRTALSQFATSHLGPGSHRSFLDPSGSAVSSRFLPKNQFARELGVDTRTLNRLLPENSPAMLRTKTGKRERVWIDTTAVQIAKKVPGRVYRMAAAARILAIPKSVLRTLRETGVFAVTHLPEGARGIHELDIAAFDRKLKEQAAPRQIHGASVIPFQKAVRNTHCTVEMKVEIVERILEGRIPLFGGKDTPIGQLQVPCDSIFSFVRCESARLASDSLNRKGRNNSEFPLIIREAANVIGCSQKAIPQLVSAGYLEGMWKGNTLWVDRNSLRRFGEKYVRIATVAKHLHTSAETLMKFCRKYSIPMVVCALSGKDGNQAFVLREYEAKLSRFQEADAGALWRLARKSN